MRWDVLALAELNADVVVAGLTGPPAPGHEVLARSGRVSLGSSTALCAAALARLGLRVAVAGKVGRDALGELVLAELAAAGVDVTLVRVAPALTTGFTVAVAGVGGERSLITFAGDTVSGLRPDELPGAALEQARHLHVSAFFLQQALAPGLAGLFRRAAGLGLTTSLDTGDDPDGRWDSGLGAVLAHTSLFLPNAAEAMAITGACSEPAALADLLARGCKAVALKQGPRGAILAAGTTRLQAGPLAIDPIDTTGAGDAFNAGLLYGCLNGWEWGRALRFGNGCGALTATRIGGSAAFAGAEEVEAFLAAHGA